MFCVIRITLHVLLVRHVPLFFLPPIGSINTEGIPGDPVDWDALFALPRDYWLTDVAETRKYLEEQVGEDLPQAIRDELDELEKRLNDLF